MLSGEVGRNYHVEALPSHDNFSQPSQITLISRDSDILFYLPCNLRIIRSPEK